MTLITIIAVLVSLFIGGTVGYLFFRYVLKNNYQRTLAEATKEADVIKEKKLLEVKEKFLNKKSEL